MPAFNAARTLARTHREALELGIVDQVIVVDDGSHDETVAVAHTLEKTTVHVHARNRGYGANQKTCYRLALEAKADIVVMVHPDYQYTPRLIPAMTGMVASGLYDVVLGSRILGGNAMKQGMPWWKYAGNRFLTATQNLATGANLSEYHTGYRAFSRKTLERLPTHLNSDGFTFDAQMLLQALWLGFRIGEVSCPTRYDSDASSIGFAASVAYGMGCLQTAAAFRLANLGVRSLIFPERS